MEQPESATLLTIECDGVFEFSLKMFLMLILMAFSVIDKDVFNVRFNVV